MRLTALDLVGPRAVDLTEQAVDASFLPTPGCLTVIIRIETELTYEGRGRACGAGLQRPRAP